MSSALESGSFAEGGTSIPLSPRLLHRSNLLSLVSMVRTRIHDARKARIWIKDQYFNPHETWHSLDEVLGWFDDNGVEYLNCSPPILGTGGEGAPALFDETDPGTAYQRVITQLSWIGTIAREGALFDVIGRKGG